MSARDKFRKFRSEVKAWVSPSNAMGIPPPLPLAHDNAQAPSHNLRHGLDPPETEHSNCNHPSAVVSCPTPAESTPGESASIPNSGPMSSSEDGWHFMRLFYKSLGQSTRSFGPLRETTFSKGRKEYESLRTELELLFKGLQDCYIQDVSPTMKGAVEGLCRSIEREVSYIQEKKNRSKTRQYIEAKEDADNILECYRRVHNQLRRVSLNVNMAVWRIVDEIATDNRLKYLTPSSSACYNSAKAIELKRGPCTEGTRVELLRQILDWVDYSNPGSLYWINGMAGTGKTTIAYSLCAELGADHRLAASFFCSRLLPECRDVNLIIPSIAYQFARFSHPFRCVLSSILDKDPDVHTRLPHLQFDALISQPLLGIKDTLPDSLVVVIDALDECENPECTSRMLDVLLAKSPGLPIKFVVSSRPEPEVRDQIAKQFGRLESQVVLHELDKITVRGDIEAYLRAALAQIQPTEGQITTLVERAGILFIYAATIVRYISYNNFRGNSRIRLANVLSSTGAGEKKHKDIDELYTVILRAALENPELEPMDVDDIRQILHTVVCAQEPMSIIVLSKLLDLNDTDRVHAALRPLWSVLHISGENELVATLHASFPNYMLDPLRSKQYHCDPKTRNQLISLHCFRCFKETRPQFNICALESSHLPDDRVAGLEERVDSVIKPELFYSARYWAVHLCSTTESHELISELRAFLLLRLLLWMEVMTLKKCAGAMPQAIRLVERWDADRPMDLRDFIHDAWRFTTTYALGAASKSTPHIYISMLPFWPESSPLSKVYTKRSHGMVKIEGPAISHRHHALLASWQFDYSPVSPMISPDGTQIAVGVGDDVLLLSASTVRFSPNGLFVVSGSQDHTIRIWSAHTGELVLGPLECREDVSSITFSPDSTRIVFGQSGSLWVWDVSSGACLSSPFNHLGVATEVLKYSPDGRYMITCEFREVVVRHSQGGQLFKTLPMKDSDGPSPTDLAWLVSADMSPNGSLVAGVSTVNIIYVWEVETEQVILRLLTPQTSKRRWFFDIPDVCFSPDGLYLASTSDDGAIYLWDAQNGGRVLGPLDGHLATVTSVRFSPDGAYLLTGSNDKTIRLWDTRGAQETLDPLPGHVELVASVAFSPDGTRIVSGSKDEDIFVWDAESGKRALGPLKQDFGDVFLTVAVAYSPDNARIMVSIPKRLSLLDSRTGSFALGTFSIPDFLGQGTPVFALLNDTCVIAILSYSTVSILAVDTGQTLMVLHPPLIKHKDARVASAQFSPDGTCVAIGMDPHTLCIYDTQSGTLLHGPYQRPNINTDFIDFSPDGTQIVLSHNSRHAIMVLDLQSGEMTSSSVEECKTTRVRLAEFSPDGAYIVSVAYDGIACIWSAPTCSLMQGPFQCHTGNIRSAMLSPDGTRVVSGSPDSTIRVTNILADQNQPIDPSNPISNEWELNEEGWVIDKQGRWLVWVPHELRAILMLPRTHLVISRKGWLRLNFDDALLGESWTGCYRPD